MTKESQRDDIIPSDHYDPSGWGTQQRQWLRLRDSNNKGEPACRFFELREIQNQHIWVPCNRTRSIGYSIQAHHIYPQGLQRRHPRPEGGNNPYNGIMLCTGKRNTIGHHDLMAPHMLPAKMTYPWDRTSYTRWINNAHEALTLGLDPYVHEWDGMLRSIARGRTDSFKKRNPDKPWPKGVYVGRDH